MDYSQAMAMLEKLIAFPTVSRDSNLGLIEWVRDYLAGFGVKCRLTYDAAKKKANLFATLGEGRKPGIILSGHTDVVPVDGQSWDFDPFKVTVKDGRIYGRGSADMKGFIAQALALTPKIMEAALDSALHFSFSYDEEVGCIGVRSLIADLADIGLKPAACIVGEPTMMQPIIAHKSMNRFRCHVHGKEAHSSLTPMGVNAIEYAARIVTCIRQIADRLAQTEQHNHEFAVPHSTLQTGVIRGGIAPNIVPRECEFDFEMRGLPGADVDAIYGEIRAFAESLTPEMRHVAAGAGIEIERLGTSPGLSTEQGSAIAQLVGALTQKSAYGAVSYSTEAGLFQRAGIPTVICGPGDIAQAHRPNEYMEIEQFNQCGEFMNRLLGPVAREQKLALLK